MTLDDDALDTLFRTAHTYHGFDDRPVDDETLHALYDLLKWAPTTANSNPARFVFVRSREAQGEARPRAVGGQPRQDDGRAVHGDRRLRPRVLRQAADALPARRRAELVRRQARGDPGHRVPQRHAAGRLPDPGRARARPRLRRRCPASTTPRSTRRSSPARRSGRTSWSTSATANPAKIHKRNPRLAFDEACTDRCESLAPHSGIGLAIAVAPSPRSPDRAGPAPRRTRRCACRCSSTSTCSIRRAPAACRRSTPSLRSTTSS